MTFFVSFAVLWLCFGHVWKSLNTYTFKERPLVCPKCSQHKLVRPDYQSPYICGNCGGTWILAKELARLSATVDEVETSSSTECLADSKTGLCPDGHGIMLRAKIDLDNPFYLERCSHCGGVWFDRGELEQVLVNNLASMLPNLWSDSWQRKQREKESRERYWEINRSLLGDNVFSKIVELSKALREHPEQDRALAFLRQVIRATT